MELFKIEYKEEAEELINGMEKSLLLMESNPDDLHWRKLGSKGFVSWLCLCRHD
jgi:hypothetical protein